MKRILVLNVLHHDVEKIKLLLQTFGEKFVTAIDTGAADSKGAYYMIIASNVELTQEQVDYIYENDPHECEYSEDVEAEEPLIGFHVAALDGRHSEEEY